MTVCTAIFDCSPALSQDTRPVRGADEHTFAYTPGEGVSFGGQQLVTAEFELAFDSKYMLYGVVDGKDPVVTF